MKDNRLEKEFDEYFKGVNISDDITADAKKAATKKRAVWPRVAKFASIAASIVLVFAVALTVILKTDFNKSTPQGGGDSESGAPPSSTPDDPPSAGGPPSEDDARFVLYTDSDLVERDASAYSLASLNPSLKLIEKFAFASNASVTDCKTAYKDDKLALVKANVNILSGLNRDETTVYVEFTEIRTVYYELSSYFDGKVDYYSSAQYYLTSTTGENGEPQFKLHVLYGSVKYYFNISSSDKKAYEKYLNMVTGK